MLRPPARLRLRSTAQLQSTRFSRATGSCTPLLSERLRPDCVLSYQWGAGVSLRCGCSRQRHPAQRITIEDMK
ncbi:hypothetical protein GCM10007320_26200 [Pseudorhodoferax aquiterrae]|uniref:Uncharacterized protein n=1 Tax=Pseudorhodoferax aquiterrae TaxID=747304 RepID=A0ABQ3G1L5_9BURK|nr:hypothetical protein GCM10007320_26200 [Pseudorhodoferax aquiterrae]